MVERLLHFLWSPSNMYLAVLQNFIVVADFVITSVHMLIANWV